MNFEVILMENFFALMVLVAILGTFVCFIGFIVKWIIRKPKKRWGIATLVSFILIWLFGFLIYVVSCKGEYIEISRTEPTCTTPGKIVYECEKCGDIKSDTIDALGHNMQIVSRIEPTENLDGEIVRQCDRCKFEQIEKLNKLSSDSETTQQITIEQEIVGNTIDELMPKIKVESDSFVETLMSFGFTEDEAIENAKILKQCGIPSIEKCEPTDKNATIDGLVAYRWKMDDNRIIWFTVENRKIFYVALNGEDLYDEDKGGYLKNFDEVHIPETSVSLTVANELRDKTETVLDSYFASSRYYDAWAYAREDNKYMLQCQASDGSILTSNWIYCYVWYEQQDNGDFVVTGVQINGKQYEPK